LREEARAVSGLLPIILIVAIFPLSLLAERWLGGRYGAYVASAAVGFSVIMALLYSEYKFVFAFVAIVIGGRYLYRRRRVSGGVKPPNW
jgi:hypothetical protein